MSWKGTKNLADGCGAAARERSPQWPSWPQWQTTSRLGSCQERRARCVPNPKSARIGKCAHESGRSAPALERFAPVDAVGVERFAPGGGAIWLTRLGPHFPPSSGQPSASNPYRARIGNDHLGRECIHETASACHHTSRRTTAGSGGRGHARRPRLTGESPSEPRCRPRLSDFTRSRCSSRQQCHPQRRVIQCRAWKQHSPSGLRLI
jgi:hypothetical protein